MNKNEFTTFKKNIFAGSSLKGDLNELEASSRGPGLNATTDPKKTVFGAGVNCVRKYHAF